MKKCSVELSNNVTIGEYEDKNSTIQSVSGVMVIKELSDMSLSAVLTGLGSSIKCVKCHPASVPEYSYAQIPSTNKYPQ